MLYPETTTSFPFTDCHSTPASTSTATTNTFRQVSALAVPPLEGVVQRLFNKGVAASTLKAYSSAHKRYLDFCSSFNISPIFPLSESSLCYFVAHLHTQGLKHQTIKCYLSGIRHAQIALSMPDPFSSSSWPKLEYVLKGVKHLQAESNCQSRQRLPITPFILCKMFKVWDASSHNEALMLKAACCMGFFGFLRAAEFTTPSWREYDKGSQLSLGDVAVDSHSNPSLLRVHIKQSKTDPFRRGVHIYLGRAQSDICPVVHITRYLAAKGKAPGPLFLCSDGSPLSRPKLVAKLREALKAAGVEAKNFSGHSFRIGAATTAAANGMEDSLIQILGRWQSSAYLQYVKVHREQLARVSLLLSK